MSKKNHYINNDDFLKSISQYKKLCKLADLKSEPHPPIPDYIGECFFKIANNLSRKPNFISYPFREEMVGDGIENCIRYFRNFDETKSKNPFSYFHQIIFHAFLRRIEKELKEFYIKCKTTEQVGILDELELLVDEQGVTKQFEVYDNITDFIIYFEDKMKRKKANKKIKIKGVEKFIGDVGQ